MAEFTGYKETSSRHLRFKLQSLSRRLDELEEATKNLQKAEDELLELQDKVIQAEGSNSSMLADIEALRKRVLKIEGKDEEIKKAEELCRLMKEKLEEEESLTRELKSEIEHLQKRMAELEKLEEAFGRSKNDCTQLCLSLNEERNLTKKISTELEILRVKVKELEASEEKMDKTEQSLTGELEKLKSLALSFISERKHFNEREKQNEKIIQELTLKLEQNNKLNRADQTRNASNLLERSSNNLLDRNDLRIEDDLTSALPSKETRRKGSVDYLKHVENETRNKSENQKNKNQEDNKVKDLTQEIERLKTQIKHFESLEEELKKMRAKNSDLQDSYLSEQNKNKLLTSQLEEIKMQIKKQKDLENGEVENEDASFSSRGKHDRAKYRAVAADFTAAKHKPREVSPQQRRERVRNRDFSFSNDSSSHGGKQTASPSLMSRKAGKASGAAALAEVAATDVKRLEEKCLVSTFSSGQKEASFTQNEGKRSKEQPSVLSRYPPAAHEQKSWKTPPKPVSELRSKAEKPSQATRGSCQSSADTRDEKSSRGESVALLAEKLRTNQGEGSDAAGDAQQCRGHCAASNGVATAYRCHVSAAESDCVGSKAEAANASTASHRQPLEGRAKRAAIPQEKELTDVPLESVRASPLTKRSHRSRSQEDILEILKEDAEQSAAAGHVSAGLKADSKTVQSSHEKLNSDEEMGRSKKANTQSDFETRKKANPKQFSNSRGVFRASLFENDKSAVHEEDSSKGVKPSDADTGGLKSRRSFSPREALRSKAIIKPAIVEKDMKAIMGGAVTETESEKQKSVFKAVTNKMTSSITIFPSEPTVPRPSTDTAGKERHITTSNIRVAPNEPSPITNSLPQPFEVAVNRSALKISETDRTGDAVLRSRTETVVSRSSIVIKTSEPPEKSAELPLDAASSRSHGSSDSISSETKHVTLRSSWRTRQGLHSLEDSQIKVEKNTASSPTNTCRSSVDLSEMEGNSTQTNSSEQSSVRSSASTNSWNTPEMGSRRTKSNLSASELLTRRNYTSDPTTASPWHRTTLPEESKNFVSSSRRKQYGSSEYLSQADTAGRRAVPTLELQDPTSSPSAPPGLQAEDQGASRVGRPTSRR
ncbi:leucine zipper protein 1 [Lagopus muta]|uniref:leucine zipper protein 1 n=1 Tax=Lagopus muta TaxID=64668 RepID=UPI00209E4A5C|nr:leucine zipper protein 1 [Lagopus muta]XP_048824916.1 leucine zipper protein 1 [Lagopus muta]XP_048824917.1 leucine zipper protein 1 [Lagopus muta]XP_048824918.1 leucine zipper protein 1 [Lagopus muta]XP_048824919.1 leucine zipper protein 1 [Lagopus muta]XP_048824922.1 leucine zipper protein 1 [Lagopus muta]